VREDRGRFRGFREREGVEGKVCKREKVRQ
jgi:hypothetical protein